MGPSVMGVRVIPVLLIAALVVIAFGRIGALRRIANG